MKRADQIAGVLLLLLSLAVLAENSKLDMFRGSIPGPGFLPFWLSLGMGILSIILIVDGLRRPEARNLKITWPSGRGLRWIILTVGGLLIYTGVLSILGYILSTFAYTAFPLKCVLSPDSPNNEGSFRPLKVTAPEGSLLNPRFPAAVGARASVGHYLPVAIFGALAAVLPGQVLAASGSPMWCLQLAGLDRKKRRFAGVFFYNGGQGASGRKDGISCLSFPSNLSATPVEVIEHIYPVVMERKVLTVDSGGPGRQRGGLGQTMDIRIESGGPLAASFMTERTKFPAEGYFGGRPGATGEVLLNGARINPKESRVIHPGDLLEISTPGGGGFGDPRERDRGAVLADLEAGLISAEQAEQEYGVSAPASA